MFISIRAKILGVLSVLLVGAIFAYLMLADRIFREDKQLLVFDTNRNAAERLAGDFEIALKRVLDKVEILSKLILTERPGGYGDALASDFFENDPELLYFQLLLQRGGQAPRLLREFVDRSHIGALKITGEMLRGIDELKLGTGKSATSEVEVENVSLGGVPLYLVRIPIHIREGAHRLVAQVVIDGRNWVEPFQAQNLSLNMAVSRSGRLLAHPEADLVVKRTDMRTRPLVRIAALSRVTSQQVEYEFEGQPYLGAFQKSSLGGFTVFSLMSKRAALSASLLLLEKTIVLSLIVVTIVFLIALWFSGNLSRPIKTLMRATGELAKGKFDTRVDVRSRDEIGELAKAFDKMARDLKTSRVQLEDYSRSLEAKVQERTHELESKNVAIREQQEALLKTERLAAVGEIAGQAAHEVLNPLTGMIARLEGVSARVREVHGDGGGVELLRLIARDWQRDLSEKGVEHWLEELRRPSQVYPGKTLAEEDVENLSRVGAQLERFGHGLLEDLKLLLTEGFRISRIVDGMRGLSRISQTRALTDVAELVRESVRASEDLLKRSGIAIETRLDAALVAEIDRDEMRQVFANLIKNSKDAIAHRLSEGRRPREQGRIVISGFARSGQIHVRFWDNGSGIATRDRDKVFEAHFTTKGTEGTGFGLSICRRFARSAGGDLVLRETELGQFTEFELVLPQAETGAQA